MKFLELSETLWDIYFSGLNLRSYLIWIIKGTYKFSCWSFELRNFQSYPAIELGLGTTDTVQQSHFMVEKTASEEWELWVCEKSTSFSCQCLTLAISSLL